MALPASMIVVQPILYFGFSQQDDDLAPLIITRKARRRAKAVEPQTKDKRTLDGRKGKQKLDQGPYAILLPRLDVQSKDGSCR
jgi:hypothetical protein